MSEFALLANPDFGHIDQCRFESGCVKDSSIGRARPRRRVVASAITVARWQTNRCWQRRGAPGDCASAGLRSAPRSPWRSAEVGWASCRRRRRPETRAIYAPINPCRLADLRPAPFTVGPRTAPLGPSETYTLDGWGAVGGCTLPAGTTGLALNVTAVDPTAATFLRLWPAGATQPDTSNLNPTPGSPPTPNAVNVKLSASGEFSIFNRFGSVNVIIDVVGVYDDHDHDDRYFTQAQANSRFYSRSQVDALLAPITAKLDTLHNPITAVGNRIAPLDLPTTATVYATVTLNPTFDGKVLASSTAYVYQTTTAQLVGTVLPDTGHHP